MPIFVSPVHRTRGGKTGLSRVLAAAAAVCLAAQVSACTTQEDPDTQTTPAETSVETSSSAEESTTETSEAEDPTITKVREIFASVAPDSLFDEFKSCSASRKEYYECSGPEVGQFQFFDSDSKASSTTQLLTSSRNAKVIEENGDRIVGWMSLADSAVISVVDNKDGKVLQQFMQTGNEDPKERIESLGLLTGEGSETDASSTESAEESSDPQVTETVTVAN
ncbi:hypothetical protein [Corynebacterium aquatimens]|uniref:Beta-N-acetylglucosaminidase n=1 Tax=Corynebacterium aquatimens TaxID=1190508 RepID=A0A931DZX6_9CORY|nr:hypothetical protein [Corynebacterium aquatimens]MBG6123185.1 hypothetical protein [Corynebacterium aquatimens]WJY66484.1 hypothetical protein CAQUA_08985 [Corynebacterium aquatimens]